MERGDISPVQYGNLAPHVKCWLLPRKRLRQPVDPAFATPKEVRAVVPGLDRDTLLRWTQEGWIPGSHLGRIGKKQAYLYRRAALPAIEHMVELVRSGMVPSAASEQARHWMLDQFGHDPFDVEVTLSALDELARRIESFKAHPGDRRQLVWSVLFPISVTARKLVVSLDAAMSAMEKSRSE
jgi:hypothetical protein